MNENLVMMLAEAIAHFEGFYGIHTVANKNNNPGNLRNWDKNLPKSSGGYDIFPNRAAGFSALYRQIIKNIGRGLTLEEFFAGKDGVYAGYAPKSDKNPTDNYVMFVIQFLTDRGFTISADMVLQDA